jgi:hypothetical protein
MNWLKIRNKKNQRFDIVNHANSSMDLTSQVLNDETQVN